MSASSPVPSLASSVSKIARASLALMLVSLPASLVSTSARAQMVSTSADLDAIDRSVAAFTGFTIGSPGGASQPIDRRLSLSPCSQPLALSWHGFRRDAVMVQCPDPGSWHIFVPVRSAPGVSVAIIVSRGEAVTIAINGNGFSVSQPGEALQAGALGDWIRVRAISEGTTRSGVIRARIIEPGQVEVPLP